MMIRLFLLVALVFLLASSALSASDWRMILDRADSLGAVGSFDSALVVGKIALTEAEESRGKTDTATARVLHRMGNYCFRLGLLDSCQSLWNRAIDIRKSALGPTSSEVASLLQNLAALNSVRGLTLNAISGLEEVLEIRKANGELRAEGTANLLNNLATFYKDVGRFHESKEANSRAREIFTEIHGPEHPLIAITLSNAAALLCESGQNSQAERYIRRAIEIYEASLGKDHFRMAQALNVLAAVMEQYGRIDEAREHLLASLAITSNTQSDRHPDLLSPLYSLADTYRVEGKWREADSIFGLALEISRETGGAKSDLYAVAAHNRAVTLSDQGEYTQADSLWSEVLAIWDTEGYSQGPFLAVVMDAQANSLEARGDTAKSESVRIRALELAETAFGDVHPKTAAARRALARLRLAQRKTDEAVVLTKAAYTTSIYLLEGNARYLSERDALQVARDFRTDRDLFLSALVAAGGPGASRSIVEIVLESKGQISDVIFRRKRKAAISEDAEVQQVSRDLQSARYALSSYFYSEAGRLESDYQEELFRLVANADSLERRLSRKVDLGELIDQPVSPTVHNMTGAIPPGGRLIEYIRYLHQGSGNNKAAPAYLAILLNSDGQTASVPLGAAVEIDSVVSLYRSHMKRVTETPRLATENDYHEYREIAGRLSKLVWEPIAHHVGPSEDIYFSPDGGLNLVSFGTLPDKDDGYVIDSHNTYYLGAGRDILNSVRLPRPKGGKLLAVGAPDFNFDQSPGSPDILGGSPTIVSSSRGMGCDCLARGLDSVRALPLSRYEVEEIARSWSEMIGGATSTLLLDSDANETRFKALAHEFRVLHVATHGFYVSTVCPDEMQSAVSLTHPLLSSGLLLAGANVRDDSFNPEGNDGLLTAFELAELDLAETELAVLSACESGLGQVSNGEGVYGLRRALHMAGVSSVVCSLWPVSDRITARFMTEVYADVSHSPAEAVLNQQLAELQRLREAGLSDHPAHWGAFIVCMNGLN